MNPLFAAGAVVLLLAGLALLFSNRDDRTLKERLALQSGRAQLRRAVAEQSVIARPVARGGFGMRISGWVGVAPGVLPMRRMPIPIVLVLAGTVGGLAAWGGTMVVGGFPAVILGLVGALGTLRMIFLWELGKHRDEAFRQIPDAIGLMVRAVRAGLPIGEAVRSVAREMPDPTRAEFQRLLGETAIGTPLDKALWGIYERTNLREYAFLSVVIGLQSQTGGSLAEALDNIGDIVRKRVAMAAKAQALAGQAKASAGILVALPPFAGTAVSFIKPGYLDALFVDSRGNSLLTTAVVLLSMGLLVIRTMIKRSTSE
ncbi:type II secretion system F family protein [Roseomonas sp. AR75]|jgi:tight adherence protein B|uniref:type II secretion system F family protein n=1 Tax=Roseomonas sp. AR75 TaxID=2562311 RepID=UPI0010BFDDF7|nr:type II secretion system F family protein [Roseomonas sp. AR75]